MNRLGRRKIERQIQTLMQRDGDRCSLCRAAFPHNCKTFGGTTAGDVVALVGECCAARLRQIITAGVYVTRSYNFKSKGSAKNLNAEQIADAINEYQACITQMDAWETSIARRAGVTSPTALSGSEENDPWMVADRCWFENNPTRSHRVRAAFPGERFEGRPAAPQLQVLVRQVAPGLRVRASFFRSGDGETPDSEEILHALFDLIANTDNAGGSFTAQEVNQLAQQYAAAARTHQ